MKTIKRDDGSVSYTYEVGDLVELTRPQTDVYGGITADTGTWGEVVNVYEPGFLATLTIKLTGSRHITAPAWYVKPHGAEHYVDSR